jgi:hypothetical protein
MLTKTFDIQQTALNFNDLLSLVENEQTEIVLTKGDIPRVDNSN